MLAFDTYFYNIVQTFLGGDDSHPIFPIFPRHSLRPACPAACPACPAGPAAICYRIPFLCAGPVTRYAACPASSFISGNPVHPRSNLCVPKTPRYPEIPQANHTRIHPSGSGASSPSQRPHHLQGASVYFTVRNVAMDGCRSRSTWLAVSSFSSRMLYLTSRLKTGTMEYRSGRVLMRMVLSLSSRSDGPMSKMRGHALVSRALR